MACKKRSVWVFGKGSVQVFGSKERFVWAFGSKRVVWAFGKGSVWAFGRVSNSAWRFP